MKPESLAELNKDLDRYLNGHHIKYTASESFTSPPDIQFRIYYRGQGYAILGSSLTSLVNFSDEYLNFDNLQKVSLMKELRDKACLEFIKSAKKNLNIDSFEEGEYDAT